MKKNSKLGLAVSAILLAAAGTAFAQNSDVMEAQKPAWTPRGIQEAKEPPMPKVKERLLGELDPRNSRFDGTAWFDEKWKFGLYFKDSRVYKINKDYVYRKELPVEVPQDDRPRLRHVNDAGEVVEVAEEEEQVAAIVDGYDMYGQALGMKIKEVTDDTMTLEEVSMKGRGASDLNTYTLTKRDKTPKLFNGVYVNGKKLQGFWWCAEHNVGVYFVGDKAYFVEKDNTYSDASEMDFSEYGGAYAKLPNKRPITAGHIKIESVKGKNMTAEYWFTYDVRQPPATFVQQKKPPKKN